MGPLKFEFRRPSLTASGEVGSLAELAGILHDEGNALVKMFGDDMEMCVQSVTQGDAAFGAKEQESTADAAANSIAEAERTRKPRKPRTGADPATASAPPPAPIPAAAPAAPPALVIPADGSIPPFLDRTAAPPPPPLLPSAPPVVPAAPPPPVAGPLGLKVIAEVQRRSVDDAAKATMVAWLSSPAAGLVVPGATFDEAIACLHMVTDDKMGGVAAALQIAA